MKTTPIKAVIFDLDGVLADTAVAHHAAWAQLAREIGFDMPGDIGERLKGVDRMTSLNIILDAAGLSLDEPEKLKLAKQKNDYYRAHIEQTSENDLLPGAREAVLKCKEAGLKTGLASASRNAPLLIEKLGLEPILDFVADAAKVAHSKPHPAIFLAAAEGLNIDPRICLGVEDASAGVEAILAANMHALGVGDQDVLGRAHHVIPHITEFDLGRWL
ncbi:MAG: beta-phosphoglucomutase [Sphingomonadales bacterium]|jgi:alpha,alpha-trehalose phosphorylase